MLRKFSVGVMLTLVFVPSTALALPEFFETLKKTYTIGPKSEVAKRQCLNCHTSVPARNAYGKTLEAEMDRQAVKKLTPEVLLALNNQDADDDLWSNGEELSRGTVPSDKNSRPIGTPPPLEAVAGKSEENKPTDAGNEPQMTGEQGEKATNDEASGEIIPKHSFHPAAVHFPIALIYFGILLDVLAAWRKDQTLKRAGWLNVLAGTISMGLAIPTGIAAWLRMGWPLEGNTLFHLILSLISLGLSLVLLLQMGVVKRTVGYWILALLTLAAITGAGHFGSMMVHPS